MLGAPGVHALRDQFINRTEVALLDFLLHELFGFRFEVDVHIFKVDVSRLWRKRPPFAQGSAGSRPRYLTSRFVRDSVFLGGTHAVVQ